MIVEPSGPENPFAEGATPAAIRTVSPAALEVLLNSPSPIVRTDFSDEDAWEAAWRDITTPREYWDEEAELDATLVARSEFEGWTGEELAALLASHNGGYARVYVVDAVTLNSPERPVHVVGVAPDDERPPFRATPHTLVDVEVQLSLGNVDWAEFSDFVDDDGVLRETAAD